MLKALSLDLRERIVKVSEAGGSTQERIAERFRAGLTAVQQVLRQWRTAKSLKPAPRPGRPRRVDAAGERKLLGVPAARPDATLDELKAARGFDRSAASVRRAIERIDRPRKKRRSSRPDATGRTS